MLPRNSGEERRTRRSAAIALAYVEAEEPRSRLARAGDLARDGGEGGPRLAAVLHALLMHDHLVHDTGGDRCGRAFWLAPASKVPCRPIEQAARRGIQAAEHLLLHPIGDRVHENRAAEMRWRRSAVQRFPPLLQVIARELWQRRKLRGEGRVR